MMKKTELRAEGHPCWLRPCEESDGPGIYAAAAESIERVGRWMGWLTKAYSPSDSTDWAKAAGADWGHGSRYEFVIIDTLCGEICGCCGLNRINQEDLVCNLGYWVRESKTRRGIATAAARLLMSFGLEVLGLQRIEVVVADGNTSSRGVAEKLGAHYEGLQRMRLRVGGVSEGHQGADLPGEADPLEEGDEADEPAERGDGLGGGGKLDLSAGEDRVTGCVHRLVNPCSWTPAA